jgi:hypothetical protein
VGGLYGNSLNELVVALVVGIAFLVAFQGVLRRYPESERSLLLLSLAIHLLSGGMLVALTLGPLRGGDLIAYADVAVMLVDRFFRAPLDTLHLLTGLLLHSGDPLPVPDFGLAAGSSGSMIAFTALGMLVTWGSLPAACVLVAGLSFYGKLRMYDVFRTELDARLHRRVLAATMLVPSAVFWSSGLIKEAFATIGLGLVFKELHAFYRKQSSVGGAIAGITGLCLIATIKGYVLVPLGLAAGVSVLLARAGTRDRRKALTVFQRVAVISLGAVVVFGAGVVSSQYDPANVVEATARQQEVGAQLSYAGSYYSVTSERSLAGQIAATPLALITALFRPFIFEARNAQSAANGLETLFFTVLAARGFRRGRAAYRFIRQQPILVFCAVFSLIMGLGVGLASTNLGTLSRYRMPMMPFLWVVVTVVAASARVATSSPAYAPGASSRLAS